MMEAARTSETSVDNYFTRQYIPEDKSELHTRRRENLKSHKTIYRLTVCILCYPNGTALHHDRDYLGVKWNVCLKAIMSATGIPDWNEATVIIFMELFRKISFYEQIFTETR
jgi:hypothetical protein